MKRLISILCIMFLLLGCLPLQAYAGEGYVSVCAAGMCGENVNYRLTLDYVLRLQGEGAMQKNATCADKYRFWNYEEWIGLMTADEGITTIGDFAFAEYGLQCIFLPKSLESIGKYAFWQCAALTDVFYAGSEEDWSNVQIGAMNDGLNGVTMHYNYAGATIGSCGNFKSPNQASAFSGCPVWVLLGDELTISGTGAADTNGFRTIQRVEENMYYTLEAEVRKVKVEEGITLLGDWLFNSINLIEEISLPRSLKTIEDKAFWNCNALKDVYFAGSEDEWSAVAIGANNDALTGAEIHFGGETAKMIQVRQESLADGRVAIGRFTGPLGRTVQAIAVRYDAEGRLLSMSLVRVNGTGQLSINLSNGETVRFFVVDAETGVPLCEERSVE
ncbi:MAG: leucine-rich repeat domain-containing protein [Clostridia bacterium]|nr:leucine-rich repeat domain-containing protein [Clostridia bacterium]